MFWNDVLKKNNINVFREHRLSLSGVGEKLVFDRILMNQFHSAKSIAVFF